MDGLGYFKEDRFLKKRYGYVGLKRPLVPHSFIQHRKDDLGLNFKWNIRNKAADFPQAQFTVLF